MTKATEKLIIYVNNEPTELENIFDLIQVVVYDGYTWKDADTEIIGRDKEQVLDEWRSNFKTYYYLKGIKYTFELKPKDKLNLVK